MEGTLAPSVEPDIDAIGGCGPQQASALVKYIRSRVGKPDGALQHDVDRSGVKGLRSRFAEFPLEFREVSRGLATPRDDVPPKFNCCRHQRWSPQSRRQLANIANPYWAIKGLRATGQDESALRPRA